MTADTITNTRILDLSTALFNAANTVQRIYICAANGDISPGQAAKLVRGIIAEINQITK